MISSDGKQIYCAVFARNEVQSSQVDVKDELIALAFVALCQNLPVVLDKDGESKEAGEDYGKLLILLNGTVIPDPLQLSDGWVSDKDGVSLWPLCMILNISDYLISRNERPLCDRLRNDYKEGW